MSILHRIYNNYDCRQKRVFKDSHRNILRRWVWYNSPYFLLISVILLWSILILLMLHFGACTDSGEYYNHLNGCVNIIGGLLS